MTVRSYEAEGGAFPAIAEMWNDCVARAARRQQLLGYDWYSAWATTYGAQRPWTGRSRIIVAFGAAGEAVAVLPLAERKVCGLSIWSLAGPYQPNRGFICVEEYLEPACRALARALFECPRWWSLLRFGPIAEVAETIHLSEAIRAVSSTCVEALSPMIVANGVPNNWEEYAATILGKRLVKDIVYYERRLRAEGRVEVRHFSNPVGDELDEMLVACRTVESRSWLAQKEGNLRFQHGVDLSFWHALAASKWFTQCRLDTWVLYFNEVPVSFALTVTAGGTRHMIANQYDTAFHKYSTGSILYFHAMKHACANGVSAVDFGGGDLHYKGRWGGELSHARSELFCFSDSLLGKLQCRALRTIRSGRRGLAQARALLPAR